MSDIELAVSGAKSIEAFLEGRFGAVGRGLHEKLTSVEGSIPGDLQKKIRFVASVRNAVVHEVGDNRMRNPMAFEATVTQIIHGLHQLAKRSPPPAAPAAAAPAAPAAVETSKVPPSGKSSGGVLSVVCDKEVAPWIFLLVAFDEWSAGGIRSVEGSAAILAAVAGILPETLGEHGMAFWQSAPAPEEDSASKVALTSSANGVVSRRVPPIHRASGLL